MEQSEHHRPHHNQPNFGFIKLLSLQSNIISDCLLSIASPFLSLFSLTFAAPSTTSNGSSDLFKKAALGFLGAAYVFLILTSLMVISMVLGVCLVRLWVEEPVHIQEKLYFDYTDARPSAVLDLGFEKHEKTLNIVPVGHVCNVRLVFVMPESDYNREIGMFQVVAESLSSKGDIISSSSFPCMLRFRSQPVRTMYTFLMGAPLLLGISDETQNINIQLLKYKEHHHPRTRYIKITLVPRAGLPFLPQIYEAKLIVSSQLPWMKRLIRNWRWTFYVWTSLYVYLTLLLVLLCFFRSLMFPTVTAFSGYQGVAVSDDLVEEPPRVVVGERYRQPSETLRRWRQSRSRRKSMVGGGSMVSGVGSDATSMSVTRDEDDSVATEEVGDSESVCH